MSSAAHSLQKRCAGPCARMLDIARFCRDVSREDGRTHLCRDCRPMRYLVKARTKDAAELREMSQPDAAPAMTFEEIALVMGITKQRVQQIEARAMRKLRNNVFTMAAIRRLLSE